MKFNLTPVKALLIATGMGAICAEAVCWYEATGNCVSSGSTVDTVYFADAYGSTSYGLNAAATFKANGEWYSYPASHSGAGTCYGSTATHDCAGPAYFTNPVTGQNSANETVSYWQFGIADGNYTDGTHQYTGVDYTSGP